MPLHHPPNSFLARLHAFDPALRIRWSDKKDCYLLERQVTRGQRPDPSCYADWDAYVAARDGYVTCFPVAPHELDDRVIATLMATDLWTTKGGADAEANRMEANESEQRALSRERWLDRIGDEAKDWYRWALTLSPTKHWSGVSP
jgi:hypothetical protein